MIVSLLALLLLVVVLVVSLLTYCYYFISIEGCAPGRLGCDDEQNERQDRTGCDEPRSLGANWVALLTLLV